MTHVWIVMATHNGARHLPEQLESFFAQTHRGWSLLVSDDASTDATPSLVEAFAAKHPERDIRLIRRAAPGSSRSATCNFLSALAAVELPEGCHVALSDQDDIWMPHRLERALDQMAGGPANPIGTFYASRTILCSHDGRPGRVSRHHPRGPSFGNALVQNIMAGNTLVLDPGAAALARRSVPAALAARNGIGVAHHDWWIYALATGVGARVILDEHPGLYYRQHTGNLMGAHRGFLKSADRFTMIRDGRFRDWIGGNVEALLALQEELAPAAHSLLLRFLAWQAGEAVTFNTLRQAGIRRQTRSGDVLLTALAQRGFLRPAQR